MTECTCGIDRTKWTDAPDPKRTNWLVTTCKACGKFIGYREKEAKK